MQWCKILVFFLSAWLTDKYYCINDKQEINFNVSFIVVTLIGSIEHLIYLYT